MSKSTKKIIIGSVVAIAIAFLVALSLKLISNATQEYGYYDILTQLNEGTYTDPTTGDFVVNDAGWIVNIQPISTTTDISIKHLAEADHDHNIGLFIGYKVDTTAKTITYAFVATEENGTKYTVYAVQQVDKSFTFTTADYSEVTTIFNITAALDTDDANNITDSMVDSAIDSVADSIAESSTDSTTNSTTNSVDNTTTSTT